MAKKRQQQITDTLMQFYQKPVAKASLELFLSIGAVIFFAIFAIRPTLVTISDLIKEIDDKEVLAENLNRKIAALNTAQTNYLQLEDRLTVLDEAIPPRPNLVETLKIIEKIAGEQQIVITAASINNIPDEVPTENILPDRVVRTSIPIRISVTGSFPAIRGFIQGLSGAQRGFEIQSISFASNEERGEDKLEATIIVGAAYFSNNVPTP